MEVGRCRRHCISEPDINLNGNACAGKIRLQTGSHATVAIVFANDMHPQRIHVEDKAIVSDISGDDVANSMAPLRMNSSRYFDFESRYRNRSEA